MLLLDSSMTVSISCSRHGTRWSNSLACSAMSSLLRLVFMTLGTSPLESSSSRRWCKSTYYIIQPVFYGTDVCFLLLFRERYSCDALYLADSGTPGRVFLAPSFALDNERIGICTVGPDQLPVVLDNGSMWVGSQQPDQQKEHLDHVIQKSVHEAVQQAMQDMQQPFKNLSIAGPNTSSQRPSSEYGSPDPDISPKKRKIASPMKTATPSKNKTAQEMPPNNKHDQG